MRFDAILRIACDRPVAGTAPSGPIPRAWAGGCLFSPLTTLQSNHKGVNPIQKKANKAQRVAPDWLPHKVHFQVHRKLPPLDRLITRAESANAPLCGSTLRVTNPDSDGSVPATFANPRGTVTVQAKMTKVRTAVTCKRCLAHMNKSEAR